MRWIIKRGWGDGGEGKWEEVGLDVSRTSWGRIGAGMGRGFLDCRLREVLMQGSIATTVVGRLKEEILSQVSCLLLELVNTAFNI